MGLYEPLFQALNNADVRYVVVGGLAVVLQGHARFTADLDLVIDLRPDAANRAMDALTAVGLQPRAPVPAKQFADRSIREAWVREKGMRVFSLWDPDNPMRIVDLFVEPPMEFEGLWTRARPTDLGNVTVRVASIEDLIQMKREAGRPQDLLDIEKLEQIRHLQEERS